MAKKEYIKTSRHTISPASSFGVFTDFLYIDSDFFEKNTPIIGAALETIVTRSGDPGIVWFSAHIVKYSSGIVGQELIAGGQWNFGETIKSFPHNLTGIFYGIGLNPIDILITPVNYVTTPMIWDIKYTLGLYY